MIHDDIKTIFFSEEQIRTRVKELGEQITKDYAGESVLCVGILKGSCIFMADIIRSINLDCEIDFMAVSSYGNGTTTTGVVQIKKDIGTIIENRNVIIIEDILDSGVTLSYIVKYLSAMKPKTIKICALLDKPERRKTEIHPDYCGFNCPNEFIVGYGLDYAQKYRNLPYIGVLKPEIYE